MSPPMEEELDKDMLCPICMQIIKDTFLSSCGHSFCFMFLATHLRNRIDCPCSHYLSNSHSFLNFSLNKIQTDLQYIEEDINAVERQRIELWRVMDRCLLKLRMFADDLNSQFVTPPGPSASKKKWVHAQVMNGLADVRCRVVEMSTQSELSCLSWNKYSKNHIASSDYEGIVTVWDSNFLGCNYSPDTS